ncbi:hypothetical protein ACRQ5Q_22325 [Bradyrhizobium sp. PMVTL-01]|uniref:hypothetical protein n=1 Tax=Bradyrhizobium sp. PMVTL-01 TaxID=3434999 RepID=UPI003F7214AD
MARQKFSRFSFAAAALLVGAVLIGTLGSAAAQTGMLQLPTLSGTEQLDVNYPCTVSCFATTNQVAGFSRGAGSAGFRNALVGGDFTTNPFQRGTSQAADIANTVTYGPDQWWFVGGASSAINWSKQTGANDITGNYGASLRFQRKSGNANTAAISMGQVLESSNSYRFSGHTAYCELWAKTGANYSGGAVTATIGYGTGTDDTATNFASGSWANYTAVTNTFTPTSTWTRYSMPFAVPAQVASTNVSQVGFKMAWTPSGTAGANDWIEVTGIQCEVNDTGVAGGFEHRPASIELLMAQRYLLVINEPATGVRVATGWLATTTTCKVTLAFPDTMRAAPSVTFAGSALSGTTWVAQNLNTSSVLATPFLAVDGAHVPTNMNLVATLSSAGTAGQGCGLAGAGGGGKIVISAEL